jgi:hypothetical protein
MATGLDEFLGALGAEKVSPDSRRRLKELKREQAEDPSITARKLLDMLADFSTKREFRPGDLVVAVPWSPYSKPEQACPAIVVSVLDQPIIDPESDAGEASFRRELDIIIGVIAGGSFLTFHHSSRYLQRYDGPVA